MERNHSTISFILTLILCIFFIAFFYGKILVSPNEYMFSNWGDGIKNYYTYAYHIRHDTSCINFQGMNYPYGEHFILTDCHPLFAEIIKATGSIFPHITDYSIGILNFIMIISFVFTALSVWLVLKELKVNPYIAVVASLGMMALCPQVFRVGGHLALSYGFFVPLTMYLTIKGLSCGDKALWRWLLFISIVFWFYIHAYLGMMAASFVFACWIFNFLYHFDLLKRNKRHYLDLLLWVAIPVILFVLFVRITDYHIGRTNNPLGFFLSNSEPDDILVPVSAPLRPIIDKFVQVHQNWEAWSYIGLTNVIILFIVFAAFIKNLIINRKFEISQKLLPGTEIRILLLSAILLLVFAFGFPFKSWPGLLEIFPVIKHFRATGRFNWFFFFAVNMMSALILDQWFKNYAVSKKRIFLMIAVFASLLFILTEGLAYHIANKKEITQCRNLFLSRNIDEKMNSLIESIDQEKYQALIPLPFYYIGSENFSIEPSDISFRNSVVLSYHTGLPILGARLTRTSIRESKNIIQVISPDYYDKLISEDLSSGKPFLIIRTKEILSVYEDKLLSKALFLSGDDSLALFELSINDLFSSSAEQEINKFNSLKDSLYPSKGFLLSDTCRLIYFKDFENQLSPIRFDGAGALNGNKRGTNTLAGFESGTFKTGTVYSASMWMFNGRQDALNDWFRLIAEEYDSKNERYFETYVLPEQSESINGDWSLVEIEFRIHDPQNYVSLKLIGKETDRAVFYLDDLMVREKNVDVYRIDRKTENGISQLFYNNQRIILKQPVD